MPDDELPVRPDVPVEKESLEPSAQKAADEAGSSFVDLVKRQREALKVQKDPDRPPMMTSGWFGRPELIDDAGATIVQGRDPSAPGNVDVPVAEDRPSSVAIAEKEQTEKARSPEHVEAGKSDVSWPPDWEVAKAEAPVLVSTETGKDGARRHAFSDGTSLIEQPTGGAYALDANGRIVTVINGSGEVSKFEYTDQGILQAVTYADGRTWTTQDGSHWKSNDGMVGDFKISVDRAGNIVETDHGSGNSVTRKLDGTALMTDANQRVTETLNAAGEHYQFGYGTDGKINQVSTPTGDKWQTTDGITWSRGTGSAWKGMYSVDAEGTLTEMNIFGDQVIRRQNGTVEHKDVESGRISVRDAAGNWQETRRALDPAEMERAADALHQAMKGGTGAGTTEEVVFAVLEGKNQVERRTINRAYVTKYGSSLKDAFQAEMEGAELEKSLYLLDLDRKDGVPPDAGRIRTALTELGQLVEGKSSSNIERDIRLTLSTMNSQEISQLDTEYRRLYGTSVLPALMNDENLSEATREAAKVYLLGTDKRTDDHTLRLADIALKARDIDMLQEAFGGSSAAVRERFRSEGGDKKLLYAFTSKRDDEALGRKNPDSYYETDTLLRAREIAERGKLSTATLIRNNVSIAGDSEKAIDQVLSMISAEERAAYVNGRKLERGKEVAGLSDAEQIEARAQYTKTLEALTEGGNPTEIARWEDMIANRGGSLISRLADHRGTVYDSGMTDIQSTMRAINPQDWQRLNDDSDYRADVEKMLGTYLNESEMAAPRSLLDDIEKAEKFGTWQKPETIFDKLYRRADSLSDDPAAAIRDVQEEFRKNPELLARITNPQNDQDVLLREQLEIATRRAMPLPDYMSYGKPLLQKGRLPFATQLEIMKGTLDDDEAGVYDALRFASPAERKRLIDDSAAVLPFMSEAEREVAVNIAQQEGVFRPEDKMRSYVIGAGTSEGEIKQLLGSLKPAEIEDLRRDYARKYQEDLNYRLIGELGGTDWKEARRDLLAQPETSRDAFHRAVDEYLESRQGIGNVFADAWDGAGIQTDQAISNFAGALGRSSAEFKQLPRDEQEKLQQDVHDALDRFRESKGAAGDAMVDAVLIAAGIGAAKFTGGVSLSLLAKTTLLGAAFKVASKGAIMGSDYDMAQGVTDALTGGIDAASIVLGPPQLAQLMGMGQRAAATASARVLEEAGATFLKKGAKETLERGMAEVMASSIANGAEKIDQTAIRALAGKVAKDASPETIAALEKSIAQNLNVAVKREMEDGVKAIARKVALDASAGALGGGASGAVRGAVEWDETKSFDENLKMLAESTAVSAIMGAQMASAFSLGFEALGKSLSVAGDLVREKPVFSLESDVTVNGKKLSPGGEQITIGRPDAAGADPRVSRQHVSLKMDEKGRVLLIDHSAQGTYIKRAGSDLYDPVKLGQPVPLGPGDEVRLGSPDGPRLELDARSRADAPELARTTDAGAGRVGEFAPGRSQVSGPSKAEVESVLPGDDSILQYKVDGEPYHLSLETLEGDKKGSEQWYYYSRRKEIPDSPVKVEIDTSDPQDLGRLQELLIPALMKDSELKELAPVWKTFDPRLGVDSPGRGQVTGQGNNAKAFTFYVDGPEQAEALQKKLDELLASKGLGLDRTLETGNVAVDRGQSNRVGIVRDRWNAAIGPDGTLIGARLDEAHARRIHDMFGLGPDEILTPEQVRIVEEAAGIRPDTLMYDNEGYLSLLKVSESSGTHPGGGYYLDERLASRVKGDLTDRQALYALGQVVGVDQVDLVAGRVGLSESSVGPAPVRVAVSESPPLPSDRVGEPASTPDRPFADQPTPSPATQDASQPASEQPAAAPPAPAPAPPAPAPPVATSPGAQPVDLAKPPGDPPAAAPASADRPVADQPAIVEEPVITDKTVFLDRPLVAELVAPDAVTPPVSQSHQHYEIEVGGQRVSAAGSEIGIGRSAQSQIRVDDPNVGDNHVNVRFTDGGVYLKSLDSEHGTFVNGRKLRLDEEIAIRPGDRVTLGEPPQGAELNLFLKPKLDSTSPLVVKVGDRELGPGSRRRLTAGGTAIDATVRMDDTGAAFVRDNGSAVGIYMNGTRIMPGEEVPFRRGDAFTYGDDVIGKGKPMPVTLESRPRYTLQVGPANLDLSMGPVVVGRDRNGITDRAISSKHATVEMRDNGIVVTDHSTNGTWVLRDGTEIKLTRGEPFELKPADQVYLGKSPKNGGERLDLISLDAHPDALPPREILRTTGDLTPQALAQSNDFSNRHEISARLEDGWHNAGALNEIGRDGSFKAPYPRVATVVDRANDPVLRQVIDDARRRFGDLPPRERAEALTRYAKQLLTPPEMIGPDGSERALDAWYAVFSNDHAGERVLLGEFIRQGTGVCSQQATLLKVLADELDLSATLVRGNGSDGGNKINHAWTTFDLGDGGGPVIFDPRQTVYGQAPTMVPSHKAGRAINKDTGFSPRVDHGFRPGDRVDFDDIGGWRLESMDPKTKDAVLVHDGGRSIRTDDFASLNGGDAPIIGERYQMRRSDGTVESGWRFEGLNPDRTLRFYKEDAVRRSVSSLELFTGGS